MVYLLVGVVGSLLIAAYFGSQASYWRMRSREFYEFHQHLIDTGVIEWTAFSKWRNFQNRGF